MDITRRNPTQTKLLAFPKQSKESVAQTKHVSQVVRIAQVIQTASAHGGYAFAASATPRRASQPYEQNTRRNNDDYPTQTWLLRLRRI